METSRNIYFIEKEQDFSSGFSQHYARYQEALRQRGYNLIYLPFFLRELSTATREYLVGSSDTSPRLSSQSLKKLLGKTLWDRLPSASFVYHFPLENQDVVLSYSAENASPEGLFEQIQAYQTNYFRRLQETVHSSVRYSISAKDVKRPISKGQPKFSFPMEDSKTTPAEDRNIRNLENPKSFDLYVQELTAEQRKLAYHAKQCIAELKGTGLPLDFIYELVKPILVLNELVITQDYQILIPALNKEIDLVPLDKALYLFYLNHPEGVNFKDLMDHFDELYALYKQISPRWNFLKLRSTVKNMIDPTKNGIHVHATHIKKCFQVVFDEEIAHHYYISGEKGADKRILLDRSLVKWE